MDAAYVELWLKAFAVTLAIEVPIYAVLLSGRIPSLKKRLVLGAVFQWTHPVFWLVAWPLLPTLGWYWEFVIVCELIIWLLEAMSVAMALGWQPHSSAAFKSGLFVAFIPNLISFLVGLAFFH